MKKSNADHWTMQAVKFLFSTPIRIAGLVVATIRKAAAPLPVAGVKFYVEATDAYPAGVEMGDALPAIAATPIPLETLYRKVGKRYVAVNILDVLGGETLYAKNGNRYAVKGGA